jgi:uncharacterized protein (DUF362 family)/NAD-dependent dihydropyrimidine dehydrogenase PreA subunit
MSVKSERFIKIGIIGCGKIVTMFSLAALKKIPKIKIEALCDNNEKRLSQVGKKTKAQKLYSTYESLLQDPDIDAVYIATPPQYRHAIIRMAIKEKKHILCEKPLCRNYEEAEDILKHAPKNLIIMPAHNYAYSPSLEWTMDIIKEGKIGEVIKVENHFDLNINLWNNVSKHQFDMDVGGVLYDHFAHLVYTANRFAGKLHSIEEIDRAKGKKGVYDKVVVKGSSEIGIESDIRASWRHILFSWNMRVIGKKGSIHLKPQTNPYWIKVVDNNGKTIEKRKDKSMFSHFLSPYSSYQQEFEDFADSILEGRKPKVPLEEAVETMRIIDLVKNWDSKDTPLKEKTKVVIEEASYGNAAEKLEKIISQFNLNWKGKKVLLKPNIVGGWGPEQGATTHPAIVLGTMKAIEKRGGIVWIGDNPGTGAYGKSSEEGEKSEIKPAAGDRWVEMGKHPMKVKVKSKYFKELVVSKEIFDADIVVNLPKFKTHALTTITGSIKNMFGILVGGQKVQIHALCPIPRNFSEALVDIYSVRKPEITIMDAIVGMEGNGPTNGTLRKIGRIIASTDGVALDSVMAAMMGIKPLEVDMLKTASIRKLGETNLSRIQIEGNFSVLSKFKLPITFASQSFLGSIASKFLTSGYGKPKLRVNKKLCVKCGVCKKHCPKGAILLDPFPNIDRSKCIGCYCCFELCEVGAISIHSLLASAKKR